MRVYILRERHFVQVLVTSAAIFVATPLLLYAAAVFSGMALDLIAVFRL